MGEATSKEKKIDKKILDDDEEGAREERSFRTWTNSLKLEGIKKVNNLAVVIAYIALPCQLSHHHTCYIITPFNFF